MQIQRNSRQVPNTKDIVAQKYYSDILYCHLQVISQFDPETAERFVLNSDINYAALGNILGITRQTVSRRFAKLLELGLVAKKDNGDYTLTRLSSNQAFLIPQATLSVLVSALNDNSITVYAYLLERYYAADEQRFSFSITGLKELCGLGTKTTSNNYIITNILNVLQKLGLITYSSNTTRTKGGQCETHYYLENATNIYEEC
ncbi:MAG: winged helix-turn-helix transcriptional regulator [Clostridia bacterium]|nr:winged helix-turn-helix transcriptional regulator [Clostridia bacterium]